MTKNQKFFNSNQNFKNIGRFEDRIYGEWSDWEACSATCGGGTMKRTRTCTDGVYGGVACTGSTMETEETTSCNDFDCPDSK